MKTALSNETQEAANMITDMRMITSETADGRKFDQLAVTICDLRMTRDIVCDRDVVLARRLAREEGVELFDCRQKTEGWS